MGTQASPSSSPYLAPDDAARALARRLLRSARHAALGCLDPETGFPLASRVLLATDLDGAPLLLLSELSAHTRALGVDDRLSLLTGEPGEGDPLRHPRLAIQGRARRLETATSDHARASRRFLSRHPSASLYAGFADFSFFRVEIVAGLLNAGFARAYRLVSQDLHDEPCAEIAQSEEELLDFANAQLANAAGTEPHDANPARVIAIDRRGCALLIGDTVERWEFATPVATCDAFRAAFRQCVAAISR